MNFLWSPTPVFLRDMDLKVTGRGSDSWVCEGWLRGDSSLEHPTKEEEQAVLTMSQEGPKQRLLTGNSGWRLPWATPEAQRV